jgi:hypothetical protein
MISARRTQAGVEPCAGTHDARRRASLRLRRIPPSSPHVLCDTGPHGLRIVCVKIPHRGLLALEGGASPQAQAGRRCAGIWSVGPARAQTGGALARLAASRLSSQVLPLPPPPIPGISPSCCCVLRGGRARERALPEADGLPPPRAPRRQMAPGSTQRARPTRAAPLQVRVRLCLPRFVLHALAGA